MVVLCDVAALEVGWVGWVVFVYVCVCSEGIAWVLEVGAVVCVAVEVEVSWAGVAHSQVSLVSIVSGILFVVSGSPFAWLLSLDRLSLVSFSVHVRVSICLCLVSALLLLLLSVVGSQLVANADGGFVCM